MYIYIYISCSGAIQELQPPRFFWPGAGYGMDPFTAAAASQAAASNLTEAMQAKLGLGATWALPRCVGCWMDGVDGADFCYEAARFGVDLFEELVRIAGIKWKTCQDSVDFSLQWGVDEL